VFPPDGADFAAEDNIIVGNVALYGATGGEAFIRGVGGERFAVRNSGATAVVEGVGDHGCEYMTRGAVVVLGRTGRNFAAGMSGGIAYVLDEDGDFEQRCNLGMVDLESFADMSEEKFVRGLIEKHAKTTGSTRAAKILKDWKLYRDKFRKVMPLEYRRVLEATAAGAAAS
jgi:glutamate synthase domain-containing protein 3